MNLYCWKCHINYIPEGPSGSCPSCGMIGQSNEEIIERKYPPRVWLALMNLGESEGKQDWYSQIQYGISFKETNECDFPYLPLSEHEAIVKEKLAEAEALFMEAIETANEFMTHDHIRCATADNPNNNCTCGYDKAMNELSVLEQKLRERKK